MRTVRRARGNGVLLRYFVSASVGSIARQVSIEVRSGGQLTDACCAHDRTGTHTIHLSQNQIEQDLVDKGEWRRECVCVCACDCPPSRAPPECVEPTAVARCSCDCTAAAGAAPSSSTSACQGSCCVASSRQGSLSSCCEPRRVRAKRTRRRSALLTA